MKKIKLLVPSIAALGSLTSAAALICGTFAKNPNEATPITWDVSSQPEFGGLDGGGEQSIVSATTFGYIAKPKLKPAGGCQFIGWYTKEGLLIDPAEELLPDQPNNYEFYAKFAPKYKTFELPDSLGLSMAGDKKTAIVNLNAVTDYPGSYSMPIAWEVTSGDDVIKIVQGTTSDKSATIEGLKEGDAILTAKLTDGSNTSSSCRVHVSNVNIPITSIDLECEEHPDGKLEKVFNPFNVKATINPGAATDKDLDWSSSDTSILTVSEDAEDGTLCHVMQPTESPAVGTAYVIAKAHNTPNVLGAFAFTVSDDFVEINDITVDYEKVAINFDEPEPQKVTATFKAKDSTLTPTYPYGAWKSANPSVATVSKDGTITMAADAEVGQSTTVTVTASDALTTNPIHKDVTVNIVAGEYDVTVYTNETEGTSEFFTEAEITAKSFGGDIVFEGTTINKTTRITKAEVEIDGTRYTGKFAQINDNDWTVTFDSQILIDITDPTDRARKVYLTVGDYYDASFELGEGVSYARTNEPIKIGDEKSAPCEYSGGALLAIENCYIQYVDAEGVTRKISGNDAFQNIGEQTFEIKREALTNVVWKFKVFLTTSSIIASVYTNVSIAGETGAYGTITANTYTPGAEGSIIAKYYIDAKYQIDLTVPEAEGDEGGTYVEIAGTKYYSDHDEIWEIKNDTSGVPSIFVHVPQTTAQDAAINVNVCTEDAALNLSVTTEGVAVGWLDPAYNVITAKPSENIEVELCLETGYGIDESSTEKTNAKIYFTSGGGKYYILVTPIIDEDHLLTIPWSPAWGDGVTKVEILVTNYAE